MGVTDAPTAGIRLHAGQATSSWRPSTHVHGTWEQARELLSGRRAVVLTGAGMSTASGVPDYRGPHAVRATPILYDDFISDPATRRRYWARNFQGWASLDRAVPNEAHHALSRWEHQDTVGPMIGIISQNVDGLHEAAGSRQLITLHGRSADVVCLGCGRIMTRRGLQERMAELNPAVSPDGGVVQAELRPDADAEVEAWQDFVVPDCPWCGGLLKPDVVFFGEPVPRARVASAFAWCDAAEVMLVAGSSLSVMSGLRFVRAMARAAKPVVIINHGATRADELADIRLDEPLTQVLPRLLAPAG